MPSYKLLVSATDTTPGYLNQKITPDFGIILGVMFAGGDEQLSIGLSQTPSLPTEYDAGSFTGSANVFIDGSIAGLNGLFQKITLTGNAVIAILGWASGRSQVAQFKVVQGAGGSKTLSFFGAETPDGGGGLSLSTAAGAVDIVHVYNDGNGNQFAWIEALNLQ